MNLSILCAYKSITGGIKVKIKISKEIIVTGQLWACEQVYYSFVIILIDWKFCKNLK